MSINSTVCKGFHHVAITASNFDESVKFYTEGLGFRKHLSWGNEKNKAVMLDSGNDNYIEIFSGGNGKKPEGAWQHLALSTDNCDYAVERARSAGAIVTMEPTDTEIIDNSGPAAGRKTLIRIAFCKGIDDEIIEFFQYR